MSAPEPGLLEVLTLTAIRHAERLAWIEGVLRGVTAGSMADNEERVRAMLLELADNVKAWRDAENATVEPEPAEEPYQREARLFEEMRVENGEYDCDDCSVARDYDGDNACQKHAATRPEQ